MPSCFLRKVQPFNPRRDWHVPELFHCDSCSHLCPRIIFYLHISRLFIVHTMSVVSVLLSEHHAIILAYINLLIVHPKSDQHLLGVVHVLGHLMGLRKGIIHKLDEIIVAVVRKIIL